MVKMKGLLWFVLILQCLAANASDFRSTCQDGEAKEGERGKIVYFIREDINMDTDMHLLLTIRNDNIPGDIVNCHWKDTLSKLRCDVIDHRFTADLIGHHLTLVLTSVTLDLAGQYVMNIIVNSSSDQATSCQFDALESKATDAQVGNTTTIVAISVSVVLLCAVIALLIILWIRKKRTSIEESGDQEANEGPRHQQEHSSNVNTDVCYDSNPDPQELITLFNKKDESKDIPTPKKQKATQDETSS